MKNKCCRWIHIAVFIGAMPFVAAAAQAAPADTGLKDTQALHGLKVAKGVFMLDLKDARRMAHVLEVIDAAGKSMARQHVKPELVVVVVGPSVAFLTKDRRGIPYMDERPVSEVQRMIGKLTTSGVRVEACGVALHGMDVAPDALIPHVTAVGNGYISAIGYQMQGYRLVPVY